MTRTRTPWRPALLPLALGLTTNLITPAYGSTFQIGEIEGRFDSSLSLGASWSTSTPDKDLIGSANGGTGFTQTGDDGRLNFKRGETFSKIFKGIHDLELKYGDTGVFVRGKYWYDFELKDESRPFKDIDDHNRKEGAKSSGAEILDAFVYHNYMLGELPGSARVGKQVVSWGESTFIQNSLNSINPIDVAAFRRPGAEVKEGLIPVNMLYLSQSMTDQLSAEAFYQLEWDQTVIDNCGTFFAPNDVLADGCTRNYRVLDRASLAALQAGPGARVLAGRGVDIDREGLLVPRGADRDARDSGQFGVALRWLGDSAEYAAYFINYHSRTPNVGYRNANAADIRTALTGLGAPALTAPTLLGRGSYYLEYPEDIRLYGLSFSTTLPTGTAWQGEISYRPNMPLQLNTTDMTAKLTSPALVAQAAGGGAAGMAAALALADADNRGYNRKEVTQLQTTLTHFFDQVLGAERLTLMGEVGYTRIGGLESLSEVRYGRDSIYGSPYGTQPSNALAAQMYGYHGFLTSSSWGYRARGILDYSNVFAGINLKPNLAWSHDVDGYGPIFNEGSKAISFGIDADYQNTYTASLSYTDFFGGDFNTTTDRDFVALSLGVNF
ncbi:TPA: DUF1302 domain-containing protein [Pseudomonas aeruginosa]|uniref:DUF1302 domain-containing protein n=1 Tax=Pseudomonas citronellolis TaxID=53408 RepID=UPI001A1BDCC8|nr:DUF1302 domain-containing protein [Pseudomonas citronellolis]MBH3547418.1 DUF1302 domain-containing protein [Pseudomonas aeruginosa]UUC47445.1 DUF1302 domain-containing protein [Pseudomonas citronellolis]HBN9703319.1 DUF1302 domain-containing protein [Pseudomonas aeruginosa]HBN9721867.1 DUF1302 domain-containing protein [Pseudomonas aeruginosa]HBN9767946.1 DUF1302 domain-containing protein [Pseudomonas aeruginosa]